MKLSVYANQLSSNPLVQIFFLVLLAYSQSSSAQNIAADISVSGFGTLGYSVLDDENAEYRSGTAQDGADIDGSFELDSRLGVQIDAGFSPQFSATIQGIVREAEAGDPEPQLEWGFLRWLASDNISLRLGRMSLPVYALSDYREVGYAYPWIRPPEDVYSQIPLRRFDGIDMTLDMEWQQAFIRWQVFAGQARERIFDDLEPDARDTIGIGFVVERGITTVRFSHARSNVDIDSDNANVQQISGGIAQAQALVPSLSAIANDFAGERVPLTFTGIALNLDFARAFLEMEYSQRRVDNWVSDVNSFSLALGTQLGQVRPYIYASVLHEPGGDRRIDLPDDDALNALEAGINRFYEPRDQQSFGIGARWDFLPQLALKAQLDRISRDETGVSFLRLTTDDGSDEGNDVTLYSVALDFIF
ncbi:MAG: hypothetical protein KTR32_03885 [Granulosicoccus sp.]|nr:hypothetical protein [Granulosicoccus sp.]